MSENIFFPSWRRLFFCLTFLLANCIFAVGSSAVVASDPTHIVLVGDSTVTDDAGWGKGFSNCLTESAICTNMAKGGRSSRSFRSEGWWEKSLALKPDFLLIQFGHNDQPGKGPQRESAAESDFRDHLRKYVDEAREAGCRPVLITSLTRRRWSKHNTIEPTLAAYAQATKIVANEKDVPLLDLNRLSIQHCNSIGPEAYRAYEPMTVKGADHTHLNAEGSQVIGAMVAQELTRIVKTLAPLSVVASDDEARLADRKLLQTEDGKLLMEQTEAAITIRQSGGLVLNYNKQSPPVPAGIDPVYKRSGFLHPVATPKSKTVTATFPWDHPHQHGIFSAWVRTTWGKRDIDFWNLAGGTGRVLHQRVVSTFANRETVGFEVDLVHRSTQTPAVDILRERWKITAYPTDGSYHCFDIESTQSALTDIPLKVQEYHYGGMAMRGPTRWLQDKPKKNAPPNAEVREPSSFMNDQGSDRKQGNHEKARWVTLTGTIDGQAASITVMCHADNFRGPQSARLHPTKPYFCFSPCVEGEFVINKKTPLVGRYRYLITDNNPGKEWLQQQWDRWSER